MDLFDLLAAASARDASDLHLHVGEPPRIRVDGRLDVLDADEEGRQAIEEEVLLAGLDARHRGALAARGEVEFSLQDRDHFPWRATYFAHRHGLAAAFRRLSLDVPRLKSLHLPGSVARFAHLHSGLVLVTGPSGAGKSTTLAALVDLINRTYARHIVTLEDPVEYLYQSDQSVVEQRSVGQHVASYAAGIEDALHLHPDVLVVGEMRDHETIHLALRAAESGILVFSTLHTIDAPRTIERVVDVFPPDDKPLGRALLAETLRGIVSQVLLPRRQGRGRIPVAEVLVGTPAVAHLIREGKTPDIAMVMQTGRRDGMNTMDDAIKSLFDRRLISAEEAYAYARAKGAYEPYLTRLPPA